jgi:hypothetical protein
LKKASQKKKKIIKGLILKKRIVKKKIFLVSYGLSYKPYRPPKQKKGVFRKTFDLSSLHVCEGDVGSGLEEEMERLIIEKNKKIFLALTQVIEKKVALFLKHERNNTLELFFRCQCGLQRSPAAVRHFARWLEINYPEIPVISEHMSIGF